MKAKALIERKSGKTGLRFSEGTKDGTDGKGKDKQQKKKVNKEEEEKPLEDCLGATLTAKYYLILSILLIAALASQPAIIELLFFLQFKKFEMYWGAVFFTTRRGVLEKSLF